MGPLYIACLLAILGGPARGAPDEIREQVVPQSVPVAPPATTAPAPPNLTPPWEKSNSVILGISNATGRGPIASYEGRLGRPVGLAVTVGWLQPWQRASQTCCGFEGVLRGYFWGAFEEGMYLAGGVSVVKQVGSVGDDYQPILRVALGVKLSSEFGITLDAQFGSTVGGVDGRVGLGWSF
jgi:hypothetical protein